MMLIKLIHSKIHTIMFITTLILSSVVLNPSDINGGVRGIGGLSFGFFSNETTGQSEYINKWREKLGLKKIKRVASISGKNTDIRLIGYGFKSTSSKGGLGAAQLQPDEDDSPGYVKGETLVYPNPFRMSGQGGVIYYDLSKSMEIELQVYDMMANMILKKTFNRLAPGGVKGRNKIQFNSQEFSNVSLSAGAYFYLLIHNGDVLSKGKMAIVP